MKVSVIVPGFGEGKQLAEEQAAKLRSKFSEIPELSFEIIVPDGKNVASARNNGLDQVSGDWIMWVDADDELSDKFWNSDVIKYALTGEYDVIVWDYELITEGKHWGFAWGRKSVSSDRLLRDVLQNCRLQSHLCFKMTKRELWHDLRFDESLERLEDFMLLPKVLARAKSVAYVPEKLYRYNYLPESLTNKLALEDRLDAVRLGRERAEEWENTDFYADALCGAASMAYSLLYKISGKDSPEITVRETRIWLRSILGELVSQCNVEIKYKLKFIIAAYNMLSVVRLGHKVRGVGL